MTFQKGQTGNPNGRGAKKLQQKRLAADLLSPHVDKAVERVVKSLESSDSADHQWAANLVMSYVFGKPAQAIEVSGKDGSPLTATITIGKRERE